MLRTKTLVLCMLALFLCSAAAMAGEEQASEGGTTTLRSLIVDGVTLAADGVSTGSVAAYRGTRYVLKEGACDGTRAGYDGLKWFAHQTPADHGRQAWSGISWVGVNVGDQAAKAPGRAWRATKWTLGHIW